MTPSRNPWESRFDTVLSTVQWVTFALAAFFEGIRAGLDAATVTAAGAGTLYIVGLTAVPNHLLRRPVVREIVALAGAFLVMIAVGLTGTTDSMYLLLSMTPVLFAAAFGGLRLGLATAGLSTSLLFALSLARRPDPIPAEDLLLWAALYLLVAIAFGRARRVLIEEREKAEQFASQSAAMTERLGRLQKSYQLLTLLARTAEGRELNPMAVGAAALDTIASVVTYEGAIVALAGDDGPVVVAKRDSDAVSLHRTMIPLTVGDREVGLVVLFTEKPLLGGQRAGLEEDLRPVALAFANILLLQEIARRAVREERTRLARELHDEIGPSLASLGLALDLALLQHPREADLQTHLKQLRGSVGTLVEEVRSTVADLRVAEPTSLTVAIHQFVAALGAGAPEVVINVNERRPPRPSVAQDLSAIVTEALRNAVTHSGGTEITIHGEVDFDRGNLTVHDNGKGFSRRRVPDGHFGLMGMEERATKIGADLRITSTKTGTAVSVSWGPD
jgi:signal transduction histidine kinase